MGNEDLYQVAYLVNHGVDDLTRSSVRSSQSQDGEGRREKEERSVLYECQRQKVERGKR